MRREVLGLLFGAMLLTGCSPDTPAPEAAASSGVEGGAAQDQEFPDIVEVRAARESGGTYSFDVTVSSPYDTPERYADGWRVLGPDNEVYGEHELTHDHASEQPFTRTQSGVEIPDGVQTVTIEGRDQANGYGGGTVEVELPTG
ncbi:hypothetical protein BH18ACT7_BH18ACT7_24970 [soil metagenome]